MVEIKIYNKLEDVLKEIPRDKEKELIEEMKKPDFVENLCKQLSSTIYGKRKDYAYDAARLIVSPFAPKIQIVDPETKMIRYVRGIEAHILVGEPSSGKSSWENVIKSQGINVVQTQIMTEGGLTGTPYMNGLVKNLQKTTWIISEGERALSNINVVNVLRSLIEEQEITKVSAMQIPGFKDIGIQSSVLISLVKLPNNAKEYQLLSRMYRVNFKYEDWKEIEEIGHKLTKSMCSNFETKLNDNFTPQPKHYFALICNKAKEVNNYKLQENLRQKIFDKWKKFFRKYYSDKDIPKGMALRDLIDCFRCAVNNAILNIFQREVKDGILYLTEDDVKKGIEFLERVMKSRAEYQEDEMKETKRGTKFDHKQLGKTFKMCQEGKGVKEIAKETGISLGRISEFRKDWKKMGLL